MSTPDKEIQLAVNLAGGDIAAFHTLYDLYHNAVYANIIKYIRRPDIAEDLLQETFFALWTHRRTLNPTKSVGGWLFTVSHNKSLLYLREALSEKKFLATLRVAAESSGEGETADPSTIDLAIDPRPIDETDLQIDILQDAIHILPPAKKQIFQLCRLEGYSYKEAASLLNTSPAVVKESLRSASKLIRKYVSSKYPALPLSTLIFLLSRF